MHKIDYRNRNNSSLMRETSPASPRMHISEVNTAPECKSKGFSGVFFCCGRLSKTLALQAENPGSSPGRSSNIFKSKAVRINICAAFFIFKGAGSIGAIPARPKGLVEGQVCKKSQDDLGTGLNTFSFEELHNILSLDKEQRVSGPKPHVIES